MRPNLRQGSDLLQPERAAIEVESKTNTEF